MEAGNAPMVGVGAVKSISICELEVAGGREGAAGVGAAGVDAAGVGAAGVGAAGVDAALDIRSGAVATGLVCAAGKRDRVRGVDVAAAAAAAAGGLTLERLFGKRTCMEGIESVGRADGGLSVRGGRRLRDGGVGGIVTVGMASPSCRSCNRARAAASACAATYARAAAFAS